MKNIHLLPTDKPSRLHKYIFEGFALSKESLNWKEAKHIYITSSDEDINENDYIITKDGRLVQVSYLLSKDLKGACKVVLTTDSQLIQDGVQAIDDEFLEWFINNPSCERADVVQMCGSCGSKGKEGDNDCKRSKECNRGYFGEKYKIIIPKEESKQIGQITKKGIIDTIGNCANCGVEFHIHKDITENQQQQGYSEEEAIEFFIEGYKQRAEKSNLIFDNTSRMYAIHLFKKFKNK